MKDRSSSSVAADRAMRFIVAGLLLFLAMAASAAKINVAVDRNPVRTNESFNLVFSAEEAPDDEPDFSGLHQDFEILGQSQGSQMSIVNGDFSRKTTWTLSLMPKRAGTLTIPPVPFGRDRSEAVEISVEDAPAAGAPGSAAGGQDMLLEVSAEPRNPYVQAQVIYTVRLYLRIDLAGADLSEPSAADALIQRLGDDRRYRTTRDGLNYMVIERQYALFPQKSGQLRIEPLTLSARVADAGRPRFGGFLGRATHSVRIQSDAVELTVRPVPEAFSGRHWLPAEQLELTETWSQEPSSIKAGEPITRTLNLRGVGSTVGVLPELITPLENAGALKVYPDQPSLNEEKGPRGITGQRQEKTALIASEPGRYHLPAVEIPWWNVRTDRLEIARIAERELVVAAAAQSAAGASSPIPAQRVQTDTPPATDTKPGIGSAPLPTDLWRNVWFWVALLCASGWLFTAWGWWVANRKGPRSSPEEKTSAGSEQAARKVLRQACRAHDAEAARQALQAWAAVRWPERAGVSLTAWAELGDAHRAAIAELQRALYGKDPVSWCGDLLWSVFADVKARSAAPGDQRPPAVLAPLYKTPDG